MTSDKELVERIREGLEGVTPGPWFVAYDDETEAPLEILQEANWDNRVCFPTSDNPATGEHLANCSPENIRALLDLLVAVEKERDEARAFVKDLHRRTQQAEGFLTSANAIVAIWADHFKGHPDTAMEWTEDAIEKVRERVKKKRQEWADKYTAPHYVNAEIAKANARAEAAEARALASESSSRELEEAREALRAAERHIVGMYRGINPHANYDNELGINGHSFGNRFADEDAVVMSIRRTLISKDTPNAE